MKKILLFIFLLLIVGCETKNNDDKANNPPSLPGAGAPPVFQGE